MQIEIVNWAKYNPRSDVKHTSWFRLENNFWIDPLLTPLDSDGKMVWLVLLSLASQAQSAVIEIDISFLAGALKVDQAKFMGSLEHIEGRGKIKIHTLRPRNARVTSTSRPRDATGRDGTDGTDGTREDANASSLSPRGRRPGPSPRDLATLWNEVSHAAMRKVDLAEFKSDSGRWTAAAARLRSKPDLDYWRQVIERLNGSPFWRGEVDPPEGRKRFLGNFDTLVRRDTHIRTMDGLYDDKESTDFKNNLDKWTDEMKSKGVK